MIPKNVAPRGKARPGHRIEEYRDRIAEVEKRLEQEAAELERKGCRMAYIHFKSDRPNIMFLLQPTEDGRRKYIYVGIDPEKQKEAREQIERHARRDAIQRNLKAIRNRSADLRWQLDAIHAGYMSLAEKDWMK